MFQDIELKIKRSKRKTLSIYVERDGSVSVFAPERLDEDELQDILKKKEYLIYKYLAEWKQLNETRILREIVRGQSFLYLGRNYRLDFVEEQVLPLMLKNGYFLLRNDAKVRAKEYFIQFYKDKGFPQIEKRVIYYEKRMGVSAQSIKIIELKNRWASCSQKGYLNFHWKCILAPLDVVSYIVVHELAHLTHKNHTRDFWNEIDKVLPEYEKQVLWLRQHGASMDL